MPFSVGRGEPLDELYRSFGGKPGADVPAEQRVHLVVGELFGIDVAEGVIFGGEYCDLLVGLEKLREVLAKQFVGCRLSVRP
ncbi:MAG: hypothetical protein R6W94_12580 [Spirochaetia bacterium]